MRNFKMKTPQRVKEAVQKRLNRMNKVLNNNTTKDELNELLISDVKNHQRLFYLLNHNRVKDAINFYEDLDTSSREMLPIRISDYLGNR